MALEEKVLEKIIRNLNRLEQGEMKYFTVSFENKLDREKLKEMVSNYGFNEAVIMGGIQKDGPFGLVIYKKGTDLTKYFGVIKEDA